MRVEIITIGDELLIGQVVDTNSAWMAEQLNLIGLRVVQISSISDQRDHILTALEEAAGRAEIILITGGLGPTSDDITKPTLSEYFNSPLVFNEEVLKEVERMFSSRGLPVTPVNRKQAEVPAAATVMPNHNGSAPGMWLEKEGRIYVSMPGVPFEMKGIMTDYVLPELQKRFSSQSIYHKTVLTQGMGESMVASRIEAWEKALPGSIKLAYLPQPGMVRLRLTGVGTDYDTIKNQVETEAEKLTPLIGELIYGYDDDKMEIIVGRLLKEKGATLSTAESCTGGYIAHLITSVPGSSDYYQGSVIAYHNDLKKNLLGISETDLQTYGAVSSEVVIAMAEGARKRLGTDYAISTSGIAGPDGGSDEKPVGTVWIAVASPSGTEARLLHLGRDRHRTIQMASFNVLNMLRKELIKKV
ncbi:MAG: competence/damage-inducible protein A [Bacteroidota bacterium]|nr:competence/damage-inducible protein A [Bacteroidota bacterium]